MLALRFLALTFIGAAIVIVVTGGLTIELGGLTLRSHRAARLWLIGIALGALSERLGGTTPPMRELMPRLGTIATRAARMAIVLAALLFGTVYATRVAGGADSSGYVSQAKLWASGRVRMPMPPIATAVPWYAGPMAGVPLGWRLGVTPDTLAPTYAPGLPIVLGAAMRFGGEQAMWLVVPILGALAVWAIGTIGRAIGGVAVMLWSSLLFLLSPVFLNSLVQPMSDVPVAGWWTLAIALLARRPATRLAIFGSGLAAAAAIATRPNLLPMVLPFVWFLATVDRMSWRAGLARVAIFGLGVLPGVLLIASLNAVWYGSPFQSGYGSLALLFGVDHMPINLRRYPAWLIETHTPFILIGLAAPLVLWWTRRRTTRSSRGKGDGDGDGRADASPLVWLCLGTIGMNVAGYVAYIPFDHWTYLRFLLPAIPLMLMLSTMVLREAVARLPWRMGLVATSLVCAALAYRALTSHQLFFVQFVLHGESRYAETAAYVEEALPRNAALLAMQHSGSLSYYTDRPIVRWDWLEPATTNPMSLDRACDLLRGRGLQPFLVLEDSEEADFKARFADRAQRALHRGPRASTRLRPFVYVYDLAGCAALATGSSGASAPAASRARARVLP